MKLVYTGSKIALNVAVVLTVGSFVVAALLGVYPGLIVYGSSIFFVAVQKQMETTYWRRRCEHHLDDSLERALRAEIPKLLGTRAVRTEKLSDIVQKVVDEAKE